MHPGWRSQAIGAAPPGGTPRRASRPSMPRPPSAAPIPRLIASNSQSQNTAAARIVPWGPVPRRLGRSILAACSPRLGQGPDRPATARPSIRAFSRARARVSTVTRPPAAIPRCAAASAAWEGQDAAFRRTARDRDRAAWTARARPRRCCRSRRCRSRGPPSSRARLCSGPHAADGRAPDARPGAAPAVPSAAPQCRFGALHAGLGTALRASCRPGRIGA